MTQLILNDDQVNVMRTAEGAMEVCNRQGELLGYFSPPPTAAEIVQARMRLNSPGPWYSTQQVIEHLDSLGAG